MANGRRRRDEAPLREHHRRQLVAAQELRLVLGGGTSIAGTGGVGGLARNLADYQNSGYVDGLTGKIAYFDTFPLDDTNGVLITSGCAYPSITPRG